MGKSAGKVICKVLKVDGEIESKYVIFVGHSGDEGFTVMSSESTVHESKQKERNITKGSTLLCKYIMSSKTIMIIV
jgi:hypothetical protein